MGVYVVTGGSGGIGGKTVEILRSQGHEVVNVDLKDSDICANLATKEGRDEVIHTIHAQYPDGIDGLCCNAGVSGACGNLKLMISLNYFGATNLAHGLFDLLKKKGGSCVVTSSNTISQGAARMDLVDMLNYSQTKPVNEERILNIIEKFDESSLAVGNSIYVTTKYALARWARRVSASWAANGVRINTVAPGNVSTPMTATMSENAKAAYIQAVDFQGGMVRLPRDTRENAPSGWFGPGDPKHSSQKIGQRAIKLSVSYIRDFVEEFRKFPLGPRK